MSRLDKYQTALLATFADVSKESLVRELDSAGDDFVAFVIDHGLGPQWHDRTERVEFREVRLAAEALYLAQEHALADIETVLESAGIEFALIKGAANRLLLYENSAIRACHDLDLLVRPDDRVRAASALIDIGFEAEPEERSISRELLLSRGEVNIDLHWELLREGRLRDDPVADMLERIRTVGANPVLSSEDALFMLLVHPAFAKHLGGWDMGLHRVMDIVVWLRAQDFNWEVVREQLKTSGVQTAAWATLRWVQLLACRSGASPRPLGNLDKMMSDTQPGRLRRKWLSFWLRNDLSARAADSHWQRLIGFTSFLHDAPADSVRALAGRRKAQSRVNADLAAFADLLDQ